ncbi:AP2/ERF domain-containing protein [Haematococcus lacustris]|uniref:AP2/ERF domain-containing protein n=1 Tax=Haematococcus lacustris TaxID=44745 RepID=A0A699YQ15_HAELA|nr:AP2/ERF domain-containing protein [Haematococcus lacustris]
MVNSKSPSPPVEQEIEAAKTFDRANLFLRGSRGKLNFGYELYVDAEGHLIPDQKLFGHITTMLQKGKGKRGRPGPGEVGGPSPNDVMVHTPGMEVSRLVAGTAAPQRMTNGMFDMPHGCSATGYLPGDDECFAMLYTNPGQPEGMGVAVWDGTGCVDLGHYDTEKDARQAATTVLKLAIFQRHLLRSGPEIVSALQSEAAHQVRRDV